MLTSPQRRLLVRLRRSNGVGRALELVRFERPSSLGGTQVQWRTRWRVGGAGEAVRCNVGLLLVGGYIEKAPPREGQPAYEDIYQLTERGRTSAFPPGGDPLPGRADPEAG